MLNHIWSAILMRQQRIDNTKVGYILGRPAASLGLIRLEWRIIGIVRLIRVNPVAVNISFLIVNMIH